MKTVLDLLPQDQRDNPEAQTLRIVAAYGALFSGRGSRDDAEVVLIDLAQFARYYDTANMTAAPSEAHAREQRRAVVQRIMDALAGAGEEPAGFNGAVLRSPPIDVNEET